MKKHLLPLLFLIAVFKLSAQNPVSTNKMFSVGMYGRVGIAYGAGIKDKFPRTLDLNGMGSIGGRFEESDYFELAAALHFTPGNTQINKTIINAQVRLAFFTTEDQFIGNVSSKSIGGITMAMPELFAEAKNIMGSPWGIWVGARYFRSDDIHIIDYFYFDDHSSQGFGITYKNTQISLVFPGSVDTTSTLPPYYYINIVNGTPRLGLRNRSVSILEHSIKVKGGYVKLMGEFHRLTEASSDDTITTNDYPSDIGYIAGVKYYRELKTTLPGSFNSVSIRYGRGIANGGDGGTSKTFMTYGGPDLETNSFRKAGSLAFTETFLWNMNTSYSLNGYGIFTKSRGASDSTNKTPDYTGTQMLFNRKTDVSFGARGTWFIKDWLHLLHELDFAWRIDGSQDAAQMTKISIVPTLVPLGARDVWSRPHFRLVYSVAYYNKFAADNLYSRYLMQSGSQRWGQYIGIKVEWWLW